MQLKLIFLAGSAVLLGACGGNDEDIRQEATDTDAAIVVRDEPDTAATVVERDATVSTRVDRDVVARPDPDLESDLEISEEAADEPPLSEDNPEGGAPMNPADPG